MQPSQPPIFGLHHTAKGLFITAYLLVSVFCVVYPTPAHAESTLLEKGHNALRKGKFAQAATHYQEAKKSLGPHPQIAWYLGLAYYGQKRYKAALQAYARALPRLPARYHPWVLNNMGNALVQSGQYGKAIQFYIKALKLDPHFARARYNLELTLRKLQQQQNPPPPPPRQQRRPPPPRKKQPPSRRRPKPKAQVIAPPKRNTLSLPEARRLRLRPFDRFIPYSRLLKTKKKQRTQR